MGFCWWPAAREGGILVGAWGNKAKRRKAAESQCPWRCSSARPRGVLKVFWELVTGGGGGADVACGLILGRWELGPASAARVGENDGFSGAVKPIPTAPQVSLVLGKLRHMANVNNPFRQLAWRV